MEDVAGVLSKDERLTLLRFLKKLGKHARVFFCALCQSIGPTKPERFEQDYRLNKRNTCAARRGKRR
jgi:hypothetical protein